LYMALKWSWVASRDREVDVHEINEHEVRTILERAEVLHG